MNFFITNFFGAIVTFFLLIAVVNINLHSTPSVDPDVAEARMKISEPDQTSATVDTYSSAKESQQSQVVNDDEAWVNYVKYYTPMLREDQMDASLHIIPWFSDNFNESNAVSKFNSEDHVRLVLELNKGITYYQKLEDDTNSAIENNTFTNLSPYYKDANVEWIEGLTEYKTGVGKIKEYASMEKGGFPINRDGWVSVIQSMNSATQHIDHVNSLVNGLS